MVKAVQVRSFPVQTTRVGAYELIKQAILSGDFQPGQLLTEISLAEWCGTSRTPIREALRRLQQDGLVEKLDRGFYVMRRSPEEILDIYDTRVILEAEAAKVAADRRSPHDISRLKLELERSFKLDGKDLEKMVESNEVFHQLIWHSTRNECLIDLLERIQLHLGRYRGASLLSRGSTLAMPGRWSESLEQHREIFESIQARDSQRAYDQMVNHLMKARALREILSSEEVLKARY
jgi:DNA-binding GntR family transcriptional regulator